MNAVGCLKAKKTLSHLMLLGFYIQATYFFLASRPNSGEILSKLTFQANCEIECQSSLQKGIGERFN
jgi:hypothetical protein